MARKRFRTPSTLPEETQCRGTVIPSSREWLGIYSDALLSLTEPWNYEQVSPTDLTPEETAALCYEQYVAWLESTCEGGGGGAGGVPALPGSEAPVYRVNPTTGRWEYIEDGAWVEPSGENAIPNPTERPEATEPLQNCGAASNAAYALRELYTNILAVYDDQVEPIINQAEIAAQIAVSIGTLFGPISAAFLEAAGGLWTLFKAGLETVTENDWSDDFQDELVCILQSNLTNTDGVVTFNHYGVCSDLVGFILPVIDDFVRVRWQVWYLLQCIGSQGLDIAGSATAVSGDCDTCDTWCYTGTPEALGAVLTQGHFTSAGYAQSDYISGARRISCVVHVDTTYCQVKRFGFYIQNDGLGESIYLYYRIISSSPSSTVETNGMSGNYYTPDNAAIVSTTNPADCSIYAGLNGNGNTMSIQAITIYGTGQNPFGIGSNC